MILESELLRDVAFFENNFHGFSGDKQQSNYMANVVQVFSGNIIYGQKSFGGTKTYVHEIFEKIK